jgi:hypothetical protein
MELGGTWTQVGESGQKWMMEMSYLLSEAPSKPLATTGPAFSSQILLK